MVGGRVAGFPFGGLVSPVVPRVTAQQHPNSSAAGPNKRESFLLSRPKRVRVRRRELSQPRRFDSSPRRLVRPAPKSPPHGTTSPSRSNRSRGGFSVPELSRPLFLFPSSESCSSSCSSRRPAARYVLLPPPFLRLRHHGGWVRIRVSGWGWEREVERAANGVVAGGEVTDRERARHVGPAC